MFALTYGALVIQLIQDYEDYAEVNKQLEKMGYNIGTRLIEDFLAKSGVGKCADFRETGEVISKAWLDQVVAAEMTDLHSKVGFKSFLNIAPIVTHSALLPPHSPGQGPNTNQSNAGVMFSLTFDENPLSEFVELPEEALEGGLWFSNVFCGVIRGALEMV